MPPNGDNGIVPNPRSRGSVAEALAASTQRDLSRTRASANNMPPPSQVPVPETEHPDNNSLSEVASEEPVIGRVLVRYVQRWADGLHDSVMEMINASHRDTQDALAHLSARLESAEADIRSLTQEVRLLRGDLNTLLEEKQRPVSQTVGNPRQGERRVNLPLDTIEKAPEQVQMLEELKALVAKLTDAQQGEPNPDNRERESRKRSGKSRTSRSSKHHRHRDDSSSSDGDDSSSDSSSESYSDSDSDYSHGGGRRSRRSRDIGKGGVHLRRKGKRYRHLRPIRPTNHLYDVLLNYRMYRLKRKSSTRSGRETGKVKDHVRRMATTLSGLEFSGKDPILVLNFLSRFVEECDVLEMKESQALLALPYFLKEDALRQYRAARDSSPKEGGVSAWPEAVQYLLRNYATNNAISEAILEFRDTQQRPDEDETAYSTRLLSAELRCGNVHSSEEKMTMFIDGLLPGIRSLVARERETRRDQSRRGDLFTYLDLVRYAQNEGEAYRARRLRLERQPVRQLTVGASRTAPDRGEGPHRTRRTQLLLESSEDTRPSRTRRYRNAETGEEVYLIPDDGSVATSQLPSTSETAEASDATMLMQGRQSRVPAPRVPFEEHDRHTRSLRPGWGGTRPRLNSPRLGMVCYKCYQAGHLSPDCREDTALEPERVVSNFEKLSSSDRDRVNAASYEQAQAVLRVLNARMAKVNPTPVGSTTTPRVGDTAHPETQGN